MNAIKGITLIAGANGGIGCGVADFMLRQGVRDIAFTYHKDDTRIKGVLEAHGLCIKRHLYCADFSSEDSLRDLREGVENNLGVVSNLVNLVGGSVNGMSWKLSSDAFRYAMELNFISAVNGCREFVPSMREQSYGRIVNTSSVVAFRGAVGAAPYAAAKAAVVGFSKSLSLELSRYGITVNSVAIGYCGAGIIDQVPESLQANIVSVTPVGRLGTTNEVAHGIEYLIGMDAGFITGQTHHINGGLF